MAGPTPNTTFNATPTTVVPSYSTPLVQSMESGVVTLYGSFVVASAAIDLDSVRGDWFTVTYTSTGLYRVTVQANLPNGLIALDDLPEGDNGQPKGLLIPPMLWLTDENLSATAVTQAQNLAGFALRSTLYDTTTNLNTFDILCAQFADNAPAVWAAADTTIDSRINFMLGFKNVANRP